MVISKKVKNALEGASWVRRMFEEGEELKRLHGAENVFDFSLGNPDLEPPASLKKALKKLADEPIIGMHRYMPNSGYSETRKAIAEFLAEESAVFLSTRTLGNDRRGSRWPECGLQSHPRRRG